MIDERMDWNTAVEELIDETDTLMFAFNAVKENFNSRRIGRYCVVLDEIMDDLRGMLHD